ncbi:MAG: hypothetical protein M3237_02760 [Actinomycetota bacterium]|nr:hypothetical protein [Actinomycetota bacterium]
MNEPVIYGPHRVRRLRIALGVAIALGMLCGVFALLIGVAADESSETIAAVILGIIGGGTVLWSVVSWRLLDTPTRITKRALILTGVLLLLFAPLTFGLFGIGLMFAILGMVLIFLAVISEADAGT